MTENNPSADDVLMGGGVPAAKFKTPGTVVGGRIVSPPSTHQEHKLIRTASGFEQGDPKTFPSGDPIYGITVDVQTDERTDSDDTGVRRIWIEGKRLKEAVRDAVRQAGAHRLEVGGTLHVKFTGEGEKADEYMNAPKLWAAKYVAPTPGPASQDDAWGAPAQQAAPQQQAAAPAPAQQQPAPQQQAAAPAPAPGQQAWPDEPPF